jgi:hypothetical protein
MEKVTLEVDDCKDAGVTSTRMCEVDYVRNV